MGVRDSFNWLIGREQQPLQTRSLESMFIAAGLLSSPDRPWRRANNREAMGVPAVFKAISLISNTIGTLSMEGYRKGAKLSEEDTPKLFIRPDPFTTPQEFWRDSAYHKARRGETWWWIAKRDFDGAPLSLINIDPREITVERNPRNHFRPIIRWLGEEMRNDDMRQMKYLPDPRDPLRGWGPLQACGAAVSVAVEAQEWAANWFAGAPSQTVIKSAVDIDATEAGLLKDAWMAGAGNLPKVIDPGIESVTELGGDPEKAQLSESRLFQNGEVALMFSMPPTLLNYAVQGSTITYQNIGQVADDLLRQCLLPHYLEPMEQTMSDLATRSTIGRFNVEGLRRADIKTRFEVHGLAIDKNIYDAAEAARQEGYVPGDVENRPVPFSAPSAVPTSLPVQIGHPPQLMEIRSPDGTRCRSCGKKHLDEIAAPYRWTCPRCKAVNQADADVQTRTATDALVTALATRERDLPPIVVQPPDLSGVEAALLQISTFILQERAEREPPQVNVTMPAMSVNPEIHVNIPPGEPPHVTVTMPGIAVGSPNVSVSPADVHIPEPLRMRRRVERDDRGLITFVTDEPVEEAG